MHDPMTHSGHWLSRARSHSAAALERSDHGDRRAALEQLRYLEEDLREARAALVAELRITGSSWPELGELLGISKQGASKVYGDRAEQLLRESMNYARLCPATAVVPAKQLEDVQPSAPVAAPAVDVPLELRPDPLSLEDSWKLPCALCDAAPGELCRNQNGFAQPDYVCRERRGQGEITPAAVWSWFGKEAPANAPTSWEDGSTPTTVKARKRRG
ncbi:hypothetical protein [Cellulomonas alba]|uniref:RNA polymerase sigma-70 region 4 domain-containing protein n=1 Tax=Cellulomonas alba TaxID=3053467 RepID=A0ABT7SKV5_9CELL|nr:hypothetical protein [Cellulomonas alba]MDM7856669.1 hypothetical protein [Cellulomonas alba]